MPEKRINQILHEITILKVYHEKKARELYEDHNLPCEYNLCDVEDAKVEILNTILDRIKQLSKESESNQ